MIGVKMGVREERKLFRNMKDLRRKHDELFRDFGGFPTSKKELQTFAKSLSTMIDYHTKACGFDPYLFIIRNKKTGELEKVGKYASKGNVRRRKRVEEQTEEV